MAQSISNKLGSSLSDGALSVLELKRKGTSSNTSTKSTYAGYKPFDRQAGSLTNFNNAPKNNLSSISPSAQGVLGVGSNRNTYSSPSSFLMQEADRNRAAASSLGGQGLVRPSVSGSTPTVSIVNSGGIIPAQQSTPIEASPNTTAPQTNRGLFSDVVSSLSGRQKPTKEQSDYLKQVEQSAKQNRAIADEAKRVSDMYGAEIARVGQLGAGAVAGNLSTGTNVVGAGNAAIASQSASQRMDALAAAQQAALQGTGQQLTAQEQQTQGLTNALSGANTQQQLGISALQQAGSLAQPNVAPYGQTVFNPLQPGFAGGNMEPSTVANQLAQSVRSGQMTYEQAVQSMGYAGGAGQQFLNQALGPGFNIPQTQAQISGQTAVLGTLPQLEAAETAAEGIKGKIVTYLASNPQLNPTDAALVNQFNSWIQGKQLTDPKFQTLFNYLNEYTNTLAPILGVGGDPTNLKTEIAASFINPRAGAPSIAEVLNNMSSLSKGKLQDIRSGATGGGVVSSPTSYGTGGGGYAEVW